MTGIKDTIYTYKKFSGLTLSDEEENLLLHVINAFGNGLKINIGSLPFVNRPFAIECLKKFEDAWGATDEMAKVSTTLLDKLTPEVEWVDITTFGDTHRKYLHLITGEVREDDPLINLQKRRNY